MKTFILKSGLVILILAAIGTIITEWVLPQYLSSNTYLAASIDKQQRLDTLPGPRLIITGGSNAAFGVDSKRIGQLTGMPVINMGLHAGLGLSYMLNETAAGVKPGDVVILSTEYYLGDGFIRLLALAAAANPRSERYMDLTPFDWIRLRVFKLQICLRLVFYGGEHLDDIYIRNGFNAEGDLLTHLNKEGILKKPANFNSIGEADYSKEVQQMNAFIATVRSKQADVCFMFPGFPESEYRKYQPALDSCIQVINTQLNCAILGSPADFMVPDSQILDARYHLKKEAREMRSVKMATLLMEWRQKAQTNRP